MKPSFCAIANRQAGEDLIGTAGHYQAYVLIECPRPWAAKVFKSENIPTNLRSYVKAVKAERSIQFLAINRGDLSAIEAITVMVYEKRVPSAIASPQKEAASTASTEAASVKPASTEPISITGYRGYEFQVDTLDQVVDCLEAHWQGDRIGKPITQKDILICTHGMRDKCCARFGHTFFREAAHSAQHGKLPNTRIWKVSHIGGHRFAPTAISLPDGRYYGRLTIEALQAIVARSGSIEQISAVYRGWGMLPTPLQVLERQLMQHRGWSWFDNAVSYRILADKTLEKQKTRELSVEVKGSHAVYRAKIVQDPKKTVYTKASCSSIQVKSDAEVSTVSSVDITPKTVSQASSNTPFKASSF